LRFTAARIVLLFLWTSVAIAAEPVKILVFPLDTPSATGNLSWLGEGIAFSISGQLNVPGIQVADSNERRKLVESLDLPPDSHLSHGSMIRVAQAAQADLVILGEFSGGEGNLRVAVRILDVKRLKLSGAITANGPLSAMPQIENELGWLILNNAGLQRGITREDFGRRIRKIPNPEFASFIQSFRAVGTNEQIQLLRKSVEGIKEFPEAHFRLSRLYFQKGDWNNALIQLSQSIKDERTDLEYEFIRGTCLVQQDQSARAIQALSHVLSVSRSFQVLNNIGVAFLRNGDSAKALNAFVEARNFARSDITVAVNLAITRLLLGNDAAARTVLEDAAKAHPKNGMLQFLLGLVLRKLEENNAAEAAMASAKALGLNVEKLQLQDPQTWCLVHTIWEH
jgi:Flp pilus assembly protein TadD